MLSTSPLRHCLACDNPSVWPKQKEMIPAGTARIACRLSLWGSLPTLCWRKPRFIYGDGVERDLYCRARGGFENYVLENTFIAANIEYQFLFDHADDADSQFDDGAFAWVWGWDLTSKNRMFNGVAEPGRKPPRAIILSLTIPTVRSGADTGSGIAKQKEQ